VSVARTLVVFAAGVIAGLINSVAGGGTLLSFPMLVWLGLDPIVANVTNTVALWPGSLASVVGFRRELRGGRPLLLLLTLPSILGALAGAALLLHTSSRTFAAIVPYLVLFATVIFATQGPILRTLHRRTHAHAAESAAPHLDAGAGAARRPPSTAWMIGAVVFQFAVAVYGGYFGAGIGIIMLAALGLLGVTDILHMNGLKNVFAVCINAVAALYFALYGHVSWMDALVLGVGAIAGGYAGAGVARRVGKATVRRAVVVIGFAVAASLLFHRP
jgi:uncharacterized membrane protein YfcA